jgi:hypothetical protein
MVFHGGKVCGRIVQQGLCRKGFDGPALLVQEALRRNTGRH